MHVFFLFFFKFGGAFEICEVRVYSQADAPQSLPMPAHVFSTHFYSKWAESPVEKVRRHMQMFHSISPTLQHLGLYLY